MPMSILLLLLTLIASAFVISDATWCVCRQDASTTALQKTLDYACGAGADCAPIQQNGACYNPNTVRDHCSYAANSYYQRKGQAQQACDFAGTAIPQTTDPSNSATGCIYPASPSAAAGTSSTSTTGTSTTNVTSGIPSILTPTTGAFSGLGPSGSNSLYDSRSSPLTAQMTGPFLLIAFSSAMACLSI